MQAIILAAGMGRRLGDLTSDKTKCMIEVNGITLIERVLTQLSQKNISKVILVIGYEGDKVRSLIGTSYQGLQIEYVVNSIYDKTNNIYSLYLAKEYLLKDNTLLLESDLIVEDKILDNLIKNKYPNLAVVDKYQSWMDGTVVKIDNENNIKAFVPKKNFNFAEINEYYKTVNIYKFSKEFSTSHYVPFLEAYSKALGNNEYYEQVLRVISLLEKPDIKALPLEDGEEWYEIDDIQDLDNAKTIFSNKENKLQAIQKRYGGYWRYPKLTDFCYLVNPYFPPKELIEEIKANFTNLLSQYPSGQNVNNLLAAKHFNISPDYILLSNGAAEIINFYLTATNFKTGIILPTFEEYKNRIHDEDKKVYYIPSNNNFSYTADDLIKFYSNDQIEQLLLINPDNPSGNYLNKADLFKIMEWTCSRKIRLILDESFVDFSDEKNSSMLSNIILERNPQMTVIRSISKSFGVPGLRLGIAATSNKEILALIRSGLSIWNINSFAEFYMQIFNKYENSYIRASEEFRNERNRFYKELQKISILKVIPSQANYFLCKVKKGTATKLTSELLEKSNILIKDCTGKSGFSDKQYVRIAVRDMKDNDKLVNFLKLL